jgi:lysozyme
MMHISERGLRLIEGFEGYSSAPYWDPYGHVWTRGYGETEGIRSDSPHLTRAEAQANLKHLVETRYEWAIRALGVEFSQDQWDALCSFVWNLGAGIFAGSLRAALQGRWWREAAGLMLEYDHAGGQVLAGLARRRREEIALFLRTPTPMESVRARFAVLLPAELRLMNTYLAYSRRPRLHRHGLRVTRAAMVHCRQVIWMAAQTEIQRGRAPEAAWAFRNRNLRYKLLWSYTK